MNDPHDPKAFDPKSVPGLTVWIKGGWDMLNDRPATGTAEHTDQILAFDGEVPEAANRQILDYLQAGPHPDPADVNQLLAADFDAEGKPLPGTTYAGKLCRLDATPSQEPKPDHHHVTPN